MHLTHRSSTAQSKTVNLLSDAGCTQGTKYVNPTGRRTPWQVEVVIKYRHHSKCVISMYLTTHLAMYT